MEQASQRRQVVRLPSRVFPLDRALWGGFPINRLALICGRKGSFKSTLALKLLANFLERCPKCLKEWGSSECCEGDPPLAIYIDTEHAINRDSQKITNDYIERMGIDMDRIYVYQPIYGEAAAEYAVEMCKLPEVGAVIVDSLANLIPQTEEESSFLDSQSRGARAKLIARMTRSLCVFVNQEKPKIAIMINHLMSKVGTVPGNYLPGGDVQKYLSSTIVQLWATAKGESRTNLDDEKKAIKLKKKNEEMEQAVEEILDNEGFEQESQKPTNNMRYQEVGFLLENSKTSRDNVAGEFAIALDADPSIGMRYGDVDDAKIAIIVGVSAGLMIKEGSSYIVDQMRFKNQKELIQRWRTDRQFHDELYQKLCQVEIR